MDRRFCSASFVRRLNSDHTQTQELNGKWFGRLISNNPFLESSSRSFVETFKFIKKLYLTYVDMYNAADSHILILISWAFALFVQ